MAKKITFIIAKERFTERKDIVLVDFAGWSKRSKFFDNIIKKEFWAKPKNVYRDKSSHPERKAEKIKDTCIKRYGVSNPSKVETVKKKTRTTNKKKYGVEIATQSQQVRTKISQTHKNNWANKNKADKILRKRKKTCIKNFGVDSPLKNQQVRSKMQNTVFKRFGVKNVSQSKQIKDKKKKTLHQSFGVEHQMYVPEIKLKVAKKQTKYYVGVDNKELKVWLANQKRISIPYSSLQQFLQKKKITHLTKEEIDNIILNYNSAKTFLETTAEKLFEIKHYNRKPKQLSKNYKPDFKLLPQIFLNVDGLYWHSECQKNKWYHFNLRKEFEESELRIFQFREDEIQNKPEVVKSIANNALNKTQNRIFARKCEIKSVKQSEASHFLNENHLMGSTNAKHLGLFFGNHLVSILSFKQRKNICKIERFCSLGNHVVIGGFSKLLKSLEQNYLKPEITEIHNWVDLRYGTGNHLKTKGFKQIRETLGWKWTDRINTYNRLRCRANMDERKLTQQEHADEMGWVKIYDAGQRLWVKQINYIFCKK